MDPPTFLVTSHAERGFTWGETRPLLGAERTGFNRRLPGADTIDVSLAFFGTSTPDSVHVIMILALPLDTSGVYGHAQLHRTNGVWRILRRWLLEG